MTKYYIFSSDEIYEYLHYITEYNCCYDCDDDNCDNCIAFDTWICEHEQPTCEYDMVDEDDEGNPLYGSASYFRFYKCSHCGEIREHFKHDCWSYCPECGAKILRYT